MLLLAACGTGTGGAGGAVSLELVRRHALDAAIEDPSGLAMGDEVLYVVSDRKPAIFVVTRYGIPVDGRALVLSAAGGAGFEAVARADDTLLVAREPTAELLRVDEVARTVSAVLPVDGAADGNNGIEGLLVRDNGDILVAKEKDPGLLIHLAPDGTELGRVDLDFAPDISGLAPLGDADCPDQLLVVSQEARTVYQIDETGALRGAWSIDADRPEGIAYDGFELYVVDEAARELLVFAFQKKCRLGGPDGSPVANGTAPPSAIRVNEVMPADSAIAIDEFGEHDDWIELHNASVLPASLDGLYLSDNQGNPRRVRLAGDLRIPPGGVLLLWADRSPEQGPNHLPFALSAAGEAVVLSDPSGAVLDSFSWTNVPDGQSYARFPDGEGDLVLCARPTPGALNGAACAASR